MHRSSQLLIGRCSLSDVCMSFDSDSRVKQTLLALGNLAFCLCCAVKLVEQKDKEKKIKSPFHSSLFNLLTSFFIFSFSDQVLLPFLLLNVLFPLLSNVAIIKSHVDHYLFRPMSGCFPSFDFCWAQVEWLSTAEHISPPPPPPALNQGPPILSLSRCLWIRSTLPLSTQFLLDSESCNNRHSEQETFMCFSSYLPVPACRVSQEGS